MTLNNNYQKDRVVQKKFSISRLERRWLLYLLDLTAIIGGFILGLYFRPDYDFSWTLLITHPVWFIYLIAMWLAISYFFQVYKLERVNEARHILPLIFSAGLVTLMVFSFTPYLPPQFPPSRFPFFVSMFFPLLFLIVSRGLYILIFSQPIFKKRMLIFGAGWAGKTIYQTIMEHGESLYKVVGFIDDNPQKGGTTVEIKYTDRNEAELFSESLKVIGRGENILDLVSQYQVTTIVLAITHDISGETYQYLADCLQYGIEIVPMPVLYEQLTGKVPVEHIGDHWSVSMPLEHPGTHTIWHATKRLFDIFWSTIGLVLLGILFPWIALIILLDSPGPILYTQIRLGLNGKPFKLYKFRSMVINAEQGHAVWAETNDPRTTRAGKLLRKIHLDEFPQFLNILKGEMSVVGPRPERPEFIQNLAAEIPFYRVRLAVKPGMAGWGLINQGYGASTEDALVKLQYDLYYIKHQSLWLDFYILVRTIFDALTFQGR